MTDAEKAIFYELEETLPKKVINAIADEVEKQFVVTTKNTEEVYGRYTRSFTVKQLVDGMESTVDCQLSWENKRKDNLTPEGFYLNLEGVCSDQKNSVKSDDFVTFWEIRHERSISTLVKLIEDYYPTSWCYDQIEKFMDCMRVSLSEKKQEEVA